jgi:hypothetical protein
VWAENIKRVRCNTCMGEHAFKASEPGSTASSSRPRAASKSAKAPKSAIEKPSAASYDSLMAGKDRSTARTYNAKEKFEVGELVSHPAFGVGVVGASRGFDKLDIVFSGGVKTLLHNRGSAPATYVRPPSAKKPDVELAEDQGDPAADTSDGPEPLPEDA